MNVTQQSTSARPGSFNLGGVHAAVLATIIAIVVVAAVVLSLALAPGGALSSGTGISGPVPAGVNFDRDENAPQR